MTIKTPTSLLRRLVTPTSTPAARRPTPTQTRAVQPNTVQTRFDSAPTRRRTDAIPADKKVPQSIRATLTEAEKKKLEQVESGAAGRFARDNVDRLTGTDAFARLDARSQTRILKDFLVSPESSISSGLLAELTNSDAFASLSPTQRQQALDVFHAADPAGQSQLVALAKREVNGESALLDTDAENQTLLSRLHGLATGELSEDFEKSGVTREELLGSIMKECASPGEINQASKNTCTATSMQYMLCEQDPAEYARLMQGLVTGDGKVRMRNGDELKVERDAIAPDDEPGRSDSERIFQATMMEYSNGAENYSNDTDESTGKRFGIFGYERSGLNADQQERGLEALFGRNFKDEDDDLIELLSDRSPADTYVRMKWGEKKEGGHAVVVTRVENGRVYFRNPWGPTSDPVGTTYSDPPRRLENGEIREESMTVEEFERWAKSAMV